VLNTSEARPKLKLKFKEITRVVFKPLKTLNFSFMNLNNGLSRLIIAAKGAVHCMLANRALC